MVYILVSPPLKLFFVTEKQAVTKIPGLPNSDSANAVRHIFFKGLRPFWNGLPNSDSANAVRHTFFSKVSDIIGKSEFANPLTGQFFNDSLTTL